PWRDRLLTARGRSGPDRGACQIGSSASGWRTTVRGLNAVARVVLRCLDLARPLLRRPDGGTTMTSYALALPGFESRRIFPRTAGMVSGPKVLIGEAVAPRGKGRRTFSLRKNDGTLGEVRLKYRALDPVPIVEYVGRQIDVVRSLRWYEYAWMALPILLLHGGALGAVL